MDSESGAWEIPEDSRGIVRTQLRHLSFEGMLMFLDGFCTLQELQQGTPRVVDR